MNIVESDSSSLARIRGRIQDIAALTAYLRTLPEKDLSDNVRHHFSNGAYVRELFIPADTIIVGKIHKTDNLNIVSRGKIIIYTPIRRMEIQAPYTFESYVGEQKVGYTLEDTVWSNVIVTESRDIDEIERFAVTEHYTDTLIEQLGEKQWLLD